MPYNWEGDLILQNTEMKDKRFVIGSEDKAVSTDVREWIAFEDNIIMKNIVRDLQKKSKLPKTKNQGDFDLRARIIWNFVATNIKYIYDTSAQRKGDFWLFPPEIYTLRQGDCEDGSFLLASLLIASGISPFCVRVVLGEVFDENGKSLGGHAWPIYKNEMGQWCILESTLDQIPSRLPEADILSEPGQSFQYLPYYCFNNYHLWEIFPDRTKMTEATDLVKYLRQRGSKVHMRKTRLPSGGWLSHITGDWEPGHLELTEEALKYMGFHPDAIDVAADASQDPDFYDWNTPWTHAQTENDDEGRTSQNLDQAVAAYLDGVERFHRGMVTRADRDKREGLFLLGYIIHSIQDLAAHQGITNAQHSHISKMLGRKNDPDHDPANRDKAREFTAQYLEFVSSTYSAAYKQLIAYQGRTLPWDKLLVSEKTKVLNRVLGTNQKGWDMSPKALLEYSALKDKYEKIKDRFPIEATRWDRDQVFSALIKRIDATSRTG